MEPNGDDLHWRMRVVPQLTTPGNFLFGGCGLGAALVALEAASGRPTVWATAQYLSYALTGSELQWDVTLAAEGGHVTQGRAVGRVDGKEILTVNAALGKDELDVGGVWASPPVVPPPDECPPRFLPQFFRNTIMDSVEVRQARGRSFDEMDGSPGDPRLCAVGAGSRPPDAVGRDACHLRRLRLGSRVATHRPPGHGP
jgi:acyl-CoA thioesterase